jgi:Holliday junction resolvase-like predicted endonuclease
LSFFLDVFFGRIVRGELQNGCIVAVMLESPWVAYVAIAFACLFLGSWISRRWSAWRRSTIAKKRGRRAQKGETDAEELLESAGYEVMERQVRREFSLVCEGEEMTFELRADLLVRRDNEVFVAEVKTGESAPDLRNAATRRQLIEYALAFESPRILLVDVEGQDVCEVLIPGLAVSSHGDYRQTPT